MSGPADSFRPLGRGAAYSFGNKLERVLWRIAWLLLARATPPQLAAWRRALLRLFGAKVGKGVAIRPERRDAEARTRAERHERAARGGLAAAHLPQIGRAEVRQRPGQGGKVVHDDEPRDAELLLVLLLREAPVDVHHLDVLAFVVQQSATSVRRADVGNQVHRSVPSALSA